MDILKVILFFFFFLMVRMIVDRNKLIEIEVFQYQIVKNYGITQLNVYIINFKPNIKI